MSEEFQNSAGVGAAPGPQMTPGRRVSEQPVRNCGTFVPLNRKYQQRSAAKQQGSKVCETIINAGGKPGEFHAHLYVTIGWGEDWRCGGNREILGKLGSWFRAQLFWLTRSCWRSCSPAWSARRKRKACKRYCTRGEECFQTWEAALR